MNRIPFADRFRASWFLALVSLTVLVPSGGCRLCCDNEDLAYPAYGGAWQRTRRDEGRVGSLFDPAGARESTLVSRDKPGTVDEVYRARQSERNRNDTDEIKDSSLSPDGEESRDSNHSDEPDDLDSDADLKRRSDKLKNLELEDIDMIPGEPTPPRLN